MLQVSLNDVLAILFLPLIRQLTSGTKRNSARNLPVAFSDATNVSNVKTIGSLTELEAVRPHRNLNFCRAENGTSPVQSTG